MIGEVEVWMTPKGEVEVWMTPNPTGIMEAKHAATIGNNQPEVPVPAPVKPSKEPSMQAMRELDDVSCKMLSSPWLSGQGLRLTVSIIGFNSHPGDWYFLLVCGQLAKKLLDHKA
jgi:hypothetical protein